MIIAGISLLIHLLFGAGSQPIFIVEDLPKEIKHNIKDKNRQKEILSVLDIYKDEVKEHRKEIKKNNKKMKEYNLDRITPGDSIEVLFTETLAIWKEIQTKGITYRLQVVEYIEPYEWEKIVAASISPMTKKEQKAHDKVIKDFKKEFSKPEKLINTHITDPDKVQLAQKALRKFEDDMKAYINANMERTTRDIKTFADRNAGREQLEQALSSVELSRKFFFDELAILHFSLIEITTEDEWKKISKSINKLY